MSCRAVTAAQDCGQQGSSAPVCAFRLQSCPLQNRCTHADRRWVTRHFDEEALKKANEAATPTRMIRRMATVEPTFATLKRMLNRGRFACWGLKSASSEYSLGVLSYNLMRAINVLGVKGMLERLA